MAYRMAGDAPGPVDSGDGKPRFDRVVVKLSGEAFADTSVGFGLDYGKIDGVARQLVEVLDLGVQVIADGIETPGERDFLQDAGVRLMQGYLFARPAFQAVAPISSSAWPV